MTTVQIMLILTTVMPQNVPDVHYPMNLTGMTDLKECWEMAHDFVARGVTKEMKHAGIVAVGGECVSNMPSDEGET